MIKRVSVLFVVCLLLLPAQVQANDGVVRIDNNEFLSIKATPLTDTVEIGSNFKFELELTNLSTENIDLVEITQIFSRCYQSSSFDKDNSIIYPGKKTKLIIETEVPYNIDWYLVDNNYYVDFDLTINYKVFEFIKNFEDEIDINPYYGHDGTSTKIYPLKISNIKDGSKYLNLSIEEDCCVFNFIENSPFFNNYCADLKHHLTLENKSAEDLYNIFIKDKWSHGECGVFDLPKKKTVTKEVNTVHYTNNSEIESIMSAEYKVLFQIDDQYYATSFREEYPTKMTNHPRLDIRLVSNDNNYLEFTNHTDNRIENLYFFFKDKYIVSDSNILNAQPIILSKDESYRFSLNSEISSKGNIFYGAVYGDILYIWSIVEYNDFQNFQYQFYKSFDIINMHKTPTPTATKKIPLFSYSPQTTPAPKVIPSPTEPAIEITSVQKQSSIPILVWIVLGAAVIVAAVLIFVLRKKAKSKDKEVDDLPHDD